jgi:hypothetical protein
MCSRTPGCTRFPALKTTALDDRKQTFEPSVQRLAGKELIIVRGENLPPLHDGSVLLSGAFGFLKSQDSSVGTG